MISKLEFLAQHPLFENLTDAELETLASISEVLEFENGMVVAYQRDVADGLMIVKQGRLYAKKVENSLVVEARDYLPGDYFGLDWVFAPSLYPWTMQAAAGNGRTTRILVIRSVPFLRFLTQNHHVIDDLAPVYDETDTCVAGFPEKEWQEALKIKAKKTRRSNTMTIMEEELLEYSARRSKWYLVVRMFWPLLALFVLAPLSYYFMTQFIPWPRVTQILGGLLAIGPIVWAIFRFLDWTNDHFIITNRRLTHREFDLRSFRVDIKTARLEQIQTVTIEKPSLIANLFSFGTARITTASQYGTISFDNIDHPVRVKETLELLSRRVKSLDSSLEQTLVRRSIEDYFQVGQGYARVEEDEKTADAKPEKESLWNRFIARYQWRNEEDGVITYRKHIFAAVREMVWPLAIAAVMAVILWLIARYDLVPGEYLYPVMAFIYVIILIWILWRLEDWRNDIYQLNDRFITDIDRMPFGFGESSKQAPLSNIQNVNAYTPGLLHTLFNYGYVEVETAGADSNITFEDVPFPGLIQTDIFHQLEEFQRKQRANEEARRHKAFAVLLDVYKQEEEQGRLPRRTPPRIEDLDIPPDTADFG
jgi:uncharacterized membrane protein YdbT with pleckstrin-like domain/CRP-like cAMP-binding protein